MYGYKMCPETQTMVITVVTEQLWSSSGPKVSERASERRWNMNKTSIQRSAFVRRPLPESVRRRRRCRRCGCRQHTHGHTWAASHWDFVCSFSNSGAAAGDCSGNKQAVRCCCCSLARAAGLPLACQLCVCVESDQRCCCCYCGADSTRLDETCLCAAAASAFGSGSGGSDGAAAARAVRSLSASPNSERMRWEDKARNTKNTAPLKCAKCKAKMYTIFVFSFHSKPLSRTLSFSIMPADCSRRYCC